MGSLNTSLGEMLGLSSPPTTRNTISNQLVYGHVLDTIFGEDSIWYDGVDSIGAVRVRLLPINYNKYEDTQRILAYPIDRSHYRLPLPGETVVVFPSFGPAVQGTYQSRYYYWKILTVDQNLTYSGLPFAGTDPYHLKPGPKILVSDADKKTFAKRFDDKLGVDKDLLTDKSSLQKPRLGERTIESRFGSMIKFSSTPSNQAIWDEETQVNNALASSEGDPLMIINVDRKVVGSTLTLKDLSVDRSKGDDTNIFLTTTQNVPIGLGCSTRMFSWDVDLRAGLVDSHAGILANLSTEFGGGFDPNGALKLTLQGDIQFTEANFLQGGNQYSSPDTSGFIGTSQAAKNGAPHYNDGTMYQRAWALNGFKYGLGSKPDAAALARWDALGRKNDGTFKIDCSGYVSYVLGTAGGSWELVERSNTPTPIVTLNAADLKEGDVIGADHGPKFKTGDNGVKSQWDANRASGIDHVAVVIKNPADGALYLAESHGGTGVHIRPIVDGVNAWNNTMGSKRGTSYVDPSDGKTKVHTHYVGNYRPATTPPTA